MSEYVDDVGCFFANVCKRGPFWGSCGFVWVGWFGGMSFVGFDGEGVIP
jgi:hypothetical protein